MTTEEDKEAILAVIKAETAAFLRRDLEGLAENWVHSLDARRMVSVANLGTHVFEGWQAIKANYQQLIEQFPETQSMTRMHWERMNIVVSGDAAWATYDQVGDKGDDKFEMGGTLHELKIFQRIDRQWKMICIVVMQRAVDHVTSPLIEINSDKTVLWMNGYAHEQITNHPFLVINGNRLRARNRMHEASLQDAVDWASRNVSAHWTQEPLDRLARAVILGESEDSAPLFCWVLVEDGKILVSFNDEQLLKRRFTIAQNIYGLTTAQAQLALLLAQGRDLSFAAEKLGVSINTVRTHLQRVFDKTGARSQSALVGLLLSADAPTSR
jgi:DNA-binding CsgD family transcriptional regulator/ketosteroid isomerase-like protein